jgi:hypothetical protein
LLIVPPDHQLKPDDEQYFAPQLMKRILGKLDAAFIGNVKTNPLKNAINVAPIVHESKQRVHGIAGFLDRVALLRPS